MADVKWIKLNVGMFDGNSFKKIRNAKIGGESFRDKLTAIWFELLDLAGKSNAGGFLVESQEIPFASIEDIATFINRTPEELNLCMQFYISNRMVTIIDDVYMLTNWTKYQNEDGLEKIREQNRIRQKNWYDRQKKLPNVIPNVRITDSNATDKDKDKEKDIDIESDNNIVDSSESTKPVTKTEINNFFESVWVLYPVKKGKGQVSDSKKKLLYSIGYDEIKRSIERYLEELKKDSSWRKPQNGSTFFNSGYVDYLDENFTPDEQKQVQQVKSNSGYVEAINNRMSVVDNW